jgi:hypothetical protein
VGRSVREKLCRQVIDYVSVIEDEMAAAGQAPGDPRTSDRLRRELDCRLAAGEFPPESK